MTDKPDPWRVPVTVAQIPETGLHRDIEADAGARRAIAEVGGLRRLLSATPPSTSRQCATAASMSPGVCGR